MRLRSRMSIKELLYEVDRLKLLIADCRYKILCFQLGGYVNEPLNEIEDTMNEAEKKLFILQNTLLKV